MDEEIGNSQPQRAIAQHRSAALVTAPVELRPLGSFYVCRSRPIDRKRRKTLLPAVDATSHDLSSHHSLHASAALSGRGMRSWKRRRCRGRLRVHRPLRRRQGDVSAPMRFTIVGLILAGALALPLRADQARVTFVPSAAISRDAEAAQPPLHWRPIPAAIR